MPRSTVDFSTVSRVLVVHLRHYGDVLLTSPVFSALKKHAPHVEADALIYDHTVEMLSFHPAVAEILSFIDTGKHRSLCLPSGRNDEQG